MKPAFVPYHPRWHRERYPIFWWLGRLSYMKFIVRELTSLAVVYVALWLALLAWALGRGEETYERLRAVLGSPPALALHGLVLLGLLVHTLTWLHLAPRAMVVTLGGRRVPDAAILAGHYVAWAVASALVLWVLVGR